jgi:hypothetical protein
MKPVLNSLSRFYGRTGHWQELWSFRKVLRENNKRAFSLERFTAKSSLERFYTQQRHLKSHLLSGLIVSSKLEKTQLFTRNTCDVLHA